MDARIDPVHAFVCLPSHNIFPQCCRRLKLTAGKGIPLGDAHIIRNAGGSVKEALRSLIISQQLLGTREVSHATNLKPGFLHHKV